MIIPRANKIIRVSPRSKAKLGPSVINIHVDHVNGYRLEIEQLTYGIGDYDDIQYRDHPQFQRHDYIAFRIPDEHGTVVDYMDM